MVNCTVYLISRSVILQVSPLKNETRTGAIHLSSPQNPHISDALNGPGTRQYLAAQTIGTTCSYT
uniref:Uncharacterized protein n=1 Tax=Megaselia scalaris TaxID=36166 RepID=T1GDG7_MEGSC